MKKVFISFILLCFVFFKIVGQEVKDSSSSSQFSPSIQELNSIPSQKASDTKVSVASYTDVGVNEAPGIITIITSDEILQLGSRDLTDILNTVPGFNIATDVQNGIAFGIRGNWSHEGKLLYMIDGMTMNELAYGTYVVGNRFPLNSIDRIEIIRGAGSSIYGGLAGLGVVNIITKKGQKINGHKIYLNGGISNSSLSRTGLEYNYGGVLLKGTEITFTGLFNYGYRSNNTIALPDSTKINFHDSSRIHNLCMNMNIKHKNFEVKQFYEDYNFQATYEPIYSLIRTYIGEINYVYKKNNFTIIPFVRYKWQIPWNTQYGSPAIYNPQNIETKKILGNVIANYEFKRMITLTLGTQAYKEKFKYFDATTNRMFSDTKKSFDGFSIFGEAFFKTKYIDVFAGCRYDKYAYFKPFWAPRITVTKNFKNIFYKFLFNESYKLPTIQNINLNVNKDIKPEIIEEGQAQVGFHNNNFDISTTIFINRLNGLIVYNYDTALIESYRNNGNINTKGIEVELKYKLKKLNIAGNYSFYTPFESTAKDVLVNCNSQSEGTLAFPVHKLYFGVGYYLNKNIKLNLFETFLSKKTIVTRINSNDDYAQIELKPTNTINFNCQFYNLFKNSLSINLGIYNILGQNIYYGYAYQSGYQPMIGMGREIVLQLKINL